MIETNERLRTVRIRLDGSYDTAKRALVGLMCKYTDSKQVRNIFQRYKLLKSMIKVMMLHIPILQNISKDFLFTENSFHYFISRYSLGRDKARDSVLDPRRYTEARETRNCTSFRSKSLRDHGKNSQKWRRR